MISVTSGIWWNNMLLVVLVPQAHWQCEALIIAFSHRLTFIFPLNSTTFWPQISFFNHIEMLTYQLQLYACYLILSIKHNHFKMVYLDWSHSCTLTAYFTRCHYYYSGKQNWEPNLYFNLPTSEFLHQVCRLSVMSCTTTAVRSPTLMWRSRSPCAAGHFITASTCSSPACSSLVWPCWSFCFLLTLERRFHWVQLQDTHTLFLSH